MKHKNQTAVSMVYEALQRSDDFRTVHELVELTRQSINRVSAALHHLHLHKAIDVVAVPVPGYKRSALYWYATPESDTRLRVVEERAPELRGRNRKPKLKPINKE